MAEVTREEIIDVFGSVAPDYSDIPTDVWGQVVSSLYGMERAEFDAFVDELEAGSRQGGTPDIRRSLVLIYDNAKRDVRATPEAQGRSEAEITAATNRVFSNIRRVVRDPAMLQEARDKGLVQWSRDNAGSSVEWSPRGETAAMGTAEALGSRGLYGDPVQMGLPLEPDALPDYMSYAAAKEAMADNRPIEEEFFSETEELVPQAPPGGWLDPMDGGNRSPAWFQGGVDQWMALTPEQRKRAASLYGPAPVEGEIGGLSPREAAAGMMSRAPGTVRPDGVPSLLARPGGAGAPAPTVTGTQTESVSTPAGTVEATETVTERAGDAPVPGAPPAQPEGRGMSPMSLGGALVGGAGIAAAIGNTIADFRTTAALEDQLAASAAGDTIARREGALAGSQAQRNIMATSMGRRDISPALALRNAQMAGSRTLSDVYGQAAIASARERRESEAQLAQLRKQRWNTLFGGLTRTAGDVGALLATQGAAEETAKMNKRLTDLEAANLNQVGLAPGQRRR